MDPAAVLAVIVKAQGIAETNAQLQRVQTQLERTDAAAAALGPTIKKAGASTTVVGKKLTKAITMPLLGIAAAATYSSLTFNREMSLIQTQAGASAKETGFLRKEVLELSKASKFGPDEVAKALFRVRSAGFKGRRGLNVLTEGMHLATLGNSDLEMTTKALTGAAKSLDLEGSKSMRHLAAEMNATVGTGDMRMEELQAALSTGVLPAFVSAGLTFRDYAAALTVATDRNVPAQIASTRLRMTIAHMSAPTEKAADALKEIGIGSEQLAKVMRKEGLPAAVQLLAEHLERVSKVRANQVIVEAFGGGKSSSMIQLMVENWQEMYLKQKLVAEGIGKYNHQIKVAEENPLVELQKAWSSIEVSLVKIGDVIVPIIVPAFIKVADTVGHAADAFAAMPEGTQKTILYIGLAVAAIGPLLRVLGFLLTSFGNLFLIEEKLAAWWAKQVAASQEVVLANETIAASYGEVAAAAEASAAAQATAATEAKTAQMSLLMPEAVGAGGQMSLLASPARSVGTSAATEEAGAAAAAVSGAGTLAVARGVAGKFAGGLARFLPGALALIGIGNILSSVMGGDMSGAAWKSGGAIAGGIAGGIAFGLPGALAGAGLGSIVGGELKKIMGGEKLDVGSLELPIGEQAKENLHTLKHGVGAQANALSTIHDSSKKIIQARHRQKQASEEVRAADSRLTRVRGNDASSTQRVVRAEIALREARHRVKQATNEVWGEERLNSRERRALMNVSVKNVAVGMHTIHQLNEQRTALSKLLGKQQQHGAGVKAEEATLKKINKVNHKEVEAHKEIDVAFAKSEKVSKRFRENLEATSKLHGVSKMAKEYGQTFEVLNSKQRHFSKIAETNWNKFEQTGSGSFRRLAEKAEHNMHRVSDATQSMKQAQQDFSQHANKYLGTVGNDYRDLKTAGEHGLDLLGESTNAFLKAVGAAKLTFGTHKEGKKAHRQSGGMVVPGSGTGDKVPLTAMVEPGEVVHVLNMRASKDRRKLSALEHMNSSTPRFQEGGSLSEAMAAAKHINAAHFPYLWGGGHGSFQGPYDCSGAVSAVLHAAGLLETPMVSGDLAHYGAPGPGPITIYANPVHAWMKIAGRPFGTSMSNPGGGAGFFPGMDTSGFAVRHPTGVAKLSQLAKVKFTGPPGELTDIGKGLMDVAHSAAAKYADAKMPGAWGGGDAQIKIKGQYSEQALEQLWRSVGGPGGVAHRAAAIAMAESGGDPHAHNPSGATGLWQILGSVLPGNLFNPVVNAKNAVAKYREAGGFSPWETFTNGAYRSFLQAGGFLMAKGGGLGKGIKHILHGLAGGKHLPKYHAQLQKLRKRIGGIGVGKHRVDQLGNTSQDIEKYAEYAANASSLTTSDEEGNITQGIFKGHSEGEWLNEQLGSLMKIRKELISVHGTIENKKLPRVDHLLHESRKRLAHVRKVIREAEQRKRELEKKIKEIEQAEKSKKHQLEKEVADLSHQIAEARRNVPPSTKKTKAAHDAAESHINDLERAKEVAQKASDHSGKQSQGEVTKLHDEIRKIESHNKARQRVETTLTGSIIPGFEGQQTGMHETLASLFTDGGEIKGISFTGLQTVQGAGGPLGEVPNPPPLGSLGGEVFAVQNRMREISEEVSRKPTPTSTEADTSKAEELLALERELNLALRKENLVLKYQYGVLASFPSVQQTAAPVVPFAGSFAKGGVMAAEVGEKGPEWVFAPEGSRVVPSQEARAALAHSGGHVKFEEINFHEAESKVSGRVNGRTFEQDVKNINRKQARRAMSSTPGGTR